MSEVTRRARSPRDKEFRRAALLRAASDLAAERGVDGVTPTAVTARVGLHPSALRRYFASREELLLALAQQGWRRWRDVLVAGLGALDDPTPEAVAGAVAGSLERLPVFCDLLTHARVSLGAVGAERAREYGLAAAQAREAVVDALVAAGLGRRAAGLLVDTATAAAASLDGLSRSAAWAPDDAEPGGAPGAPWSRGRLAEILVAVVRGADEPRTGSGTR